jgi:adenosylhomocysteine nucleosidase
MKIGIICAMEEETAFLLSKLNNVEKKTVGPFVFYEGETQDGKEVVVVKCGIGKAMSAAGCALLISNFNVGTVINSGVAGALNPDLIPNDIVFSTGVMYHDVNFTPFNYKLGQMAGQPEIYNPDPALLAKADIAATIVPNLKERIKKGLVVSGDVFVNTKEQKEEILKNFPTAMVTECEGASIAQIATSYRVPFIVIRAISDTADEGKADNYEFNVNSAAENSAKLVLALIKML